MSKYTTGEMANLCGVSVRTVQYYDTRGILIPSELSEGGRRLYSQEDLKRMKIICFLRELDFPINSIKELLSEPNPERVIGILLSGREKTLRMEIERQQKRLDKVEQLKQMIGKTEHFSVESIGDIAQVMQNKKKQRVVHAVMLVLGIVMDIFEIGSLILWIKTGIWQLFLIGMIIVCLLGCFVLCFYFNRTAYICPQCHTVFKPKFKQAFFAKQRPNARKLTCPGCRHRGFCVEVYSKDDK